MSTELGCHYTGWRGELEYVKSSFIGDKLSRKVQKLVCEGLCVRAYIKEVRELYN